MPALIASVIKETRQQKGYSQERLAELAQINLRTVQRIERGETEARGDTLNRIATALGIDITELTATLPQTAKEQNNGYLALMNMSSILIFFPLLPFLGLLVPIILWLLKKDRIEGISNAGRKIVNFQLTSLIFFCYFIYTQFSLIKPNAYDLINKKAEHTDTLPLVAIFVIAIASYVMLLIIINTFLLAKGRQAWYRPSIRFLKTINL